MVSQAMTTEEHISLRVVLSMVMSGRLPRASAGSRSPSDDAAASRGSQSSASIEDWAADTLKAPSDSSGRGRRLVRRQACTTRRLIPGQSTLLLGLGVTSQMPAQLTEWKGLAGQYGGESMVSRLRDALVANPVRMIDLLRTWDKDGSNTISPDEFCRALRGYGCPASERDIKELFHRWDSNGDGQLSLIEINNILRHGGNVRLARVLKNQPITQREIRDAPLPRVGSHPRLPRARLPVSSVHPSQRPKTSPEASAHKKYQETAAALHKARLSFASHAMNVKPETADELLTLAARSLDAPSPAPASLPDPPDSPETLEEAAFDFENVHSRSARAAAQFIDVLSTYAKRTGGQINHMQFGHALRELGVELGHYEDTAKLFSSLDTDGSGAIDLEELKAAVGFIVDPEQDSALEKLMMMDDNRLGHSIQKLRGTLAAQAARVIDLFQQWDANGDGKVTKDEFRKVLHTMPSLNATSPAAIDSLFASFDADGSGAISFGELNRMLRNGASVDQEQKKRRRGMVTPVVDLVPLREEVTMTLLQMVMRQEMREKTSAELQEELDQIDRESSEFREQTRERSSKSHLRLQEERRQQKVGERHRQHRGVQFDGGAPHALPSAE